MERTRNNKLPTENVFEKNCWHIINTFMLSNATICMMEFIVSKGFYVFIHFLVNTNSNICSLMRKKKKTIIHFLAITNSKTQSFQ